MRVEALSSLRRRPGSCPVHSATLAAPSESMPGTSEPSDAPQAAAIRQRCQRSSTGCWPRGSCVHSLGLALLEICARGLEVCLATANFLVEATNTTRATFYLRSNVTQVAVAPAPDSSRTSQKTDGDKRERLRLLPQRVLSPTSRALDFSWCTNTPASHAVLSKARVCAGAAEGWGPHLSTRFLTHRRTRRFRSHSM